MQWVVRQSCIKINLGPIVGQARNCIVTDSVLVKLGFPVRNGTHKLGSFSATGQQIIGSVLFCKSARWFCETSNQHDKDNENSF